MNAPIAHTETLAASIGPAKADRRKVLTCIFLLALVARLAHVIAIGYSPFSNYLVGDAAKYTKWASRIAAGDWVGDTVFYQAPLYPYFLAIIKVTLGDSVVAVRLVQMFVGALSCCMLAGATWNLFDRKAAIVAGVIMSLYAPSIFLESLVQKSVLDLFFISLILWLTSRILRESNTQKLWLMLGIGVGGFCLTRENAIALVPIFLLWSVLRTFQFKQTTLKETDSVQETDLAQLPKFGKRFQHACFYVLGICLLLAPVAIRNYAIGGELHITTSQLGPNFYIGNNPNATGYYSPLIFARGDAKHEQNDAIAIAETAMNKKLTAGEVSDFYMQQALNFISTQPIKWLKLLSSKVLMACNSTEIIDTEDQYVVQNYSPVLFITGLVFQFGFLLPIGIIGMIQQRRRWRKLWPIYAVCLMFASTLIVFFIFSRYRYPLVPIIAMFAAPTIANLFDELRQKSRSTQNRSPELKTLDLGNLVIMAAICVVCFLPVINRKLAGSVCYNNYANQALMRRDYETAERFIELSLLEQPAYSLAFNTRGVLHREQGNRAAAESNFRKAIQISPNYENAKRNLKNLLSDAMETK